MNVTLREKKLKNGMRSLYLDFYPPIVIDGKSTRRDFLKLYVYDKPKDEIEREHNKETRIQAKAEAAKRQLELQAGNYGFARRKHLQKDFLNFVRDYLETKKANAQSTYDFYKAVLIQLETFSGGSVKFADLNEKFCADFKNYLEHKANLSKNSASGYFDIFKTIVRDASENNLISSNPARKVKGIKKQDTKRGFLTFDELLTLSKTECDSTDLKRGALFSALTGLRFSDIQKLIWSEVRQDGENVFIEFRQKKTGGLETLPLSLDAVEILGGRLGDDERVFPNLSKWQLKKLSKWLESAGITRKITFHCFRHTFATLQMTFKTDVYTVSKLLGHKNLKTTQIYAKIIDEQKRDAVNKISLK